MCYTFPESFYRASGLTMSSSSNRAVVLIGILIVIAIAATIFFYSNRAQAPADLAEDTGTPSVIPQEQASTTENGGTAAADGAPATEQSTPSSATPTQKPASTPTPAKTPTKTAVPTFGAVITYTDTGFEPSRATIFKGQTVRFVNNSNRGMWVASDIHPLHSAYSEKSEKDCAGSTFDQCAFVQKGGYWDFKFNQLGSWDFHNDAKVTDDGTIYVVERD